jgi:hypothetical protein
MAYQIDRYNNTLLTVVEDGTIDQTTDLKLVGKNYAGYGEIQNENFIFLLENFAGANQPARPISGQCWFDSASRKLKFYDGSQWRTTGGSEIGTNQPTGLALGDFWWDSGNDQLYVYNGTSFILIGPQNAGEGVTQMVSLEVLDTTNATRGIIAATIEDEAVIVISPHNDFELSDSTPIEGFDFVRKGVTLKWTRQADLGATNSAEKAAGRNFHFWGTASSSKSLVDSNGNVILADDVVIAKSGESTTFAESVEFSDQGFTVGNSKDLQVFIENGDQAVIQNVTGQNSLIKFKASNSTGAITHVTNITATGVVPAQDNTFNLGSESLNWANVYATNFKGIADRTKQVLVGSEYVSASTSAANNTVAARDASGNISANLFQGTATQARYADLAEKYTTDQEYPVGTVMTVSENSAHETEAANMGNFAIGVISAEPAYLMNSESVGQAIGLKGRVPIRVIGAVNKGQAVYVHGGGLASAEYPWTSLVGIALETNLDEGEKLVECVLKV